jgi:hypothetical protein
MPDPDDLAGRELFKSIDTSKIYKIQYSINLLPSVCPYIEQTEDGKKRLINDEMDFFELMKDSDEFEAFKCEALKDLIKFKWDTLGFNFHLVGFFNHFAYLFFTMYYVIHVYIQDNIFTSKVEDGEEIRVRARSNSYALILLVGILLPFILCAL